MTNVDSILKSRDITLPSKVCIVKAMVFPDLDIPFCTAHTGYQQLEPPRKAFVENRAEDLPFHLTLCPSLCPGSWYQFSSVQSLSCV